MTIKNWVLKKIQGKHMIDLLLRSLHSCKNSQRIEVWYQLHDFNVNIDIQNCLTKKNTGNQSGLRP